MVDTGAQGDYEQDIEDKPFVENIRIHSLGRYAYRAHRMFRIARTGYPGP